LIDCRIDCGTGWLYDISNSYDNSFYLMGICLIVSGAMLYPILCIQRWRLRREDESTAETDPEEHVALEPITE